MPTLKNASFGLIRYQNWNIRYHERDIRYEVGNKTTYQYPPPDSKLAISQAAKRVSPLQKPHPTVPHLTPPANKTNKPQRHTNKKSNPKFLSVFHYG
jgi:hypothetical protein